MRELVPRQVVKQIFKLNLNVTLIGQDKRSIFAEVKGTYGMDGYKVALDIGKARLCKVAIMGIELKGRIDVEYLKYEGTVQIIPIAGLPDYYKMEVLELYRVNVRGCKRVPYRRTINIIQPSECEAILVNLSASGAMIECKEKIEENTFTMTFTLLKKKMVLNAEIVEERYDETKNHYIIRCKFQSLDDKSKKILVTVVREIILQAKNRLQA